MGKENINHKLFVGGLPFNATNEILETIFSNIGPLKGCFVVKDKDTGKSKGVGIVEFALSEDAERAKNEIHIVHGRKVHIEFARARAPLKERRKLQKGPGKKDAQKQREDSDSDEGSTDEDSATDEAEEEAPSKKSGAMKNSSSEQKHDSTKKSGKNRPRLIVRNLSFKASVDDLKRVFSAFGAVKEASIPTMSDGKKRGFGFVEFGSKATAVKALTFSGQKIHGRPVAVDWSVAKNKYEHLGKTADDRESSKPSKQNQDATKNESKIGKNETSTKSEEDSDRAEDTDDSDDELAKLRPVLNATKPGKPAEIESETKDSDIESESENNESESDVDSDYDAELDDSRQINGEQSDEEEEMSVEERNSDESDSNSEDSDGGSDSDIDNDSDEEMEDESDAESSEDEESSDAENGVKKKKKRKRLMEEDMNDVEEGKTLFVRNVPFDAGDDELREAFKELGALQHAVVVLDPITARSKGTGFVKFRKQEDAMACLHQLESSEKVVRCQGRILNVAQAVDRGKAVKLQEEKKKSKEKVVKDSRNLWLARESLIRPGTQAAEGLTKQELARRMQLESIMRAKLKNQTLFVSTTRLCVHNLPASVDNTVLRRIAIKAVDDPNARIDECRVMRDLARVNSRGEARSRGYAFLNFTQHAHALKALHALNNNPDIFGQKKKLIVEFSVENRLKLAMKEKRVQRQKLKEIIIKADKGKGTFSGLRKKRKERKDESDPTVARMPANLKGRKAMPSHRGAKVRHRSRVDPKKEKIERRKQRPSRKPSAEKRARAKASSRADKADNFDRLLHQYKQKQNSMVDAISKKQAKDHR